MQQDRQGRQLAMYVARHKGVRNFTACEQIGKKVGIPCDTTCINGHYFLKLVKVLNISKLS